MVGASLRYRFWSSWGVPAGRIAKGVGFATVMAVLGATTATAAAFALDPTALAPALHLSPVALRGAGIVLLVAVAAYLVACVRRVTVRLPGPGLAAGQVAVATLDWVIAGSVFFALLSAPHLSLAGFLSLFLVAQLVGVVTHVPAGLGVFDAGMLLLLQPFLLRGPPWPRWSPTAPSPTSFRHSRRSPPSAAGRSGSAASRCSTRWAPPASG